MNKVSPLFVPNWHGILKMQNWIIEVLTSFSGINEYESGIKLREILKRIFAVTNFLIEKLGFGT